MEVHGGNHYYAGKETAEEPQVTYGLETLKKAMERVKQYFWGDSSLATIFGVCRDYFGYPDNMSQFEREFDCAPGTLASTFRNNEYMRMPVSKWRENGAKDRVLKLVEYYQDAVMEVGEKSKPTE